MEATNPHALMPDAWPSSPALTPPPLPDELSGEEAFDAVVGGLMDQFNSLPPPAYGERSFDLEPPIMRQPVVEQPMAEEPVVEQPVTYEDADSAPAAVVRRPTLRMRSTGRAFNWALPLAAIVSMLLGGAVTLVLTMGPQNLWSRMAGTQGGAAVGQDAPKVVVTFEKTLTLAPKAPESAAGVNKLSVGPKSEPLDPPAPVVVTPAPVAAPVLQVQKVQKVQKVQRARKARRAQIKRMKKHRIAARAARKTAAKRSRATKKGVKAPKAVGGSWEDPYK
ncbi:MAG: hypothetical protein JRH20_03020 [Deltaproteobacteria bacterium]|nr:hypothetical protein [Deltaproteobacteria bacterium]